MKLRDWDVKVSHTVEVRVECECGETFWYRLDSGLCECDTCEAAGRLGITMERPGKPPKGETDEG